MVISLVKDLVFTVAEQPVFSPTGPEDAHSDQPFDARAGIVGGRVKYEAMA